MATTDCRRVLRHARLCGHPGEEHGWVQGEAGEWRPCEHCECPDYLPPDGMPYDTPASSFSREVSADSPWGAQVAGPLLTVDDVFAILGRMMPANEAYPSWLTRERFESEARK